MSYAIAAERGFSILLSQGTGGFGSSPNDPLNPYANLGGSGTTQPPRRSSSPWPWILGIGGGFGVAALLCCGCLGVLGYIGFNQINQSLKLQIQDDPVIQEHIGEIESVSLNLMAAIEEMKANPPPPGESLQAFDVQGTKGSGVVVGTQLPAPGPRGVLKNMRLKKGGQVYPLSE
jgi:hypothetical protein